MYKEWRNVEFIVMSKNFFPPRIYLYIYEGSPGVKNLPHFIPLLFVYKFQLLVRRIGETTSKFCYSKIFIWLDGLPGRIREKINEIMTFLNSFS